MFTLTVLYDNLPYDARLQTDWGFACLVEGPDQTLLFDTGGNGDLLLQNMRTLGIDPRAVDGVVLSHEHNDHTGGLTAFLAENPNVTVYVPGSFSEAIKERVHRAGATLIDVGAPAEINAWAHTTGEMGTRIREQGLVLKTPDGLVVVTGCAHPGIVELTERARAEFGGDVDLVMGGFHMRDASADAIAGTIADLQALGVRRVAPSHCTGDAARRAFAETFGPHCMSSGAGRILVIP